MIQSDSRINQETREETVPLITPGLPYMALRADLNGLPERGSAWHWHSEAEFFHIRKGVMRYYLPGSVHVFREGEAGFINSNVLHMSLSDCDDPTIQEMHIFLPSFVAGPAAGDIETKYIRPVLRAGGLEIHRFRDAQAVIDRMEQAYECYSAAEEGFEFRVRALLSEVWMQMFRETRELRGQDSERDLDDERIKNMLAMISRRYAEHVELEDIAAAGMVGKRECFRIFKRKLGITPVDCLIWQRIMRASELLRSTDRAVQEIARSVGFSDGSYFGKVFRERMGMTPGEYRKIH